MEERRWKWKWDRDEDIIEKIRELLFYLVNSTDSGSPFGWKRR
jgi:hypothetical protein